MREVIEASFRRIKDQVSELNSQVQIVGVSKHVSFEKIMIAHQQGVKSFGESYVQEFIRKHDLAERDPLFNGDWHFIGALQRNKVKIIIDKVALIHSVDRLSLAQEIDNQAGKVGKRQEILVQVKLSDEVSKGGLVLSEVSKLVDQVRNLNHIALKGFMLLPPYLADTQKLRPYFREMVRLGAEVFNHAPCILSMGMSHDYCIAIEEGSTMIRVGTALFGART